MGQCCDPYNLGCKGEASSSQRCHRIILGPGDDDVKIEEVYLDFCSNCHYWDSDHDYESHPKGPQVPSHIDRRMENEISSKSSNS